MQRLSILIASIGMMTAGIFAAEAAGQNDDAARPAQAAVRMAGQWSLGPTSGTPVCVLLFTAAEADTGGVRASDACRNEWRAKNFFTWRMADHRLTLLDMSGHVIRTYIQRDSNNFQDEMDLETPLFLSRPVKR